MASLTGLLAGKAALVTGAAGGIGRAIVQAFLAEGAQVLAVDVAPCPDDLQDKAGGAVLGCLADISTEAGVEAVFRAMDDRFGRIDVLVNNAAIGGPRTSRLHEVALDQFDAVMAVNVRAPLALSQAALQRMLTSGGGAIVNVASPAGYQAVSRCGPYSLSKATMVMLTKQIAREYAADGIRCNAVAPGVTRTPILDDLPGDHLDQIVSAIPQGRIAEPDEIAQMVAFLASDRASYTNGTIVFVDGAAAT